MINPDVYALLYWVVVRPVDVNLAYLVHCLGRSNIDYYHTRSFIRLGHTHLNYILYTIHFIAMIAFGSRNLNIIVNLTMMRYCIKDISFLQKINNVIGTRLLQYKSHNENY